MPRCAPFYTLVLAHSDLTLDRVWPRDDLASASPRRCRAVRGRHEFFADRPLTWVLAAGFVGMFAASIVSGALDAGRHRSPGRHSRRPQPC